MKIIIAGGTGLIGSALAESLIAQKHQVLIISRHPERVNQPYQAVSWQEDDLIQALDSADAVVNLAGESLAGNHPFQMRWTKNRKTSIINSRTEVGRKLTSAIKRTARKPTALLQSSAIGYYGNTGEGPVDESTPPGNDFLTRVCLEWEASTAEVEELGLRRVVMRTGLVLSSKGGLLPLLALPHRFFVGGPLGTGDQPMSWIHIQDVVGGMEHFLANPELAGNFNLTSPHPHSNREFSQTLGQVLGRPSWLRIPEIALTLLLGEAATLALDGRPVFPDRLLESGYDFHYPALKSALDDLLG